MRPGARKPNFGACEQQGRRLEAIYIYIYMSLYFLSRRRPVFLSTQSDQRFYCSLDGKYNI